MKSIFLKVLLFVLMTFVIVAGISFEIVKSPSAWYQFPMIPGLEEKAKKIVELVYTYYVAHIQQLDKEYKQHYSIETTDEQRVCDFVSGMTDKYIISLYKKIVIPEPWLII